MRPRLIVCEAWETAAMMAGQMKQKRVPASLWKWEPKPGALIWVQEPFVEWIGVKNPGHCDLGYRADAGPKGLFPPMPDHLKNVHVKAHVREAKQMRAGDSRITLEVTDVTDTAFQGSTVGERERQGFAYLAAWTPQMTPQEAFWAFWRRQYGDFGRVVILTFKVHTTNVGAMLKARTANAA